MSRKKLSIVIGRDLGVHTCCGCAARLGDIDFVACGVSFRSDLNFHFDYICPRCSKHGRYTLEVQKLMPVTDALRLLADFIDDGTTEEFSADWDAVDWNEGGKT